MTDNMVNSAKEYVEKGWHVFPLQPKNKIPAKGFKWKDNKTNAENLSKHFANEENIAVALGDASAGLIDLDFDCREAAEIGSILFADWPSFGRMSALNGHRMAMCNDAEKTKQFGLKPKEAEILGLSDGDKHMIIELRSSGGYTMIPPSIHPSGELIEWSSYRLEFPVVGWSDVLHKVGICAALSIVLRLYPETAGQRDNIALAMAGMLLRAGLNVETTDNLIAYIAEKKGDEEVDMRLKAKGTQERLNEGEDVMGLPKLCELLGIIDLQPTLHKWLYGNMINMDTGYSDVPDIAVAQLNRDFFVVGNEGGKCRVAFFEEDDIGNGQKKRVLRLQSPSEFKQFFANKRVRISTTAGKDKVEELGKHWFKSPGRREFERIVFAPGETVRDKCYNLWQGFAYKPSKGRWKRMRKHIWLVLAKKDPKAFKYIMKWLAWTVQNLDQPAGVALVFRGAKGTGKGTVCGWYKNLFGHHGLQVFSPKHITGNFNAHLRDCVLLYADEAIAPNDKAAENVLKGMLTEPTLAIEPKGYDVIQVRNTLHVVMSSNSDWVVPASVDERRFAVFDVCSSKMQNEKWFAAIQKEMQDGGASAMLYFFLNLDLKGWHPRKDIPQNQALADQRIESLSKLEKYWFDCLWEGEIPTDRYQPTPIIETSKVAKDLGLSVKKVGDYFSQMGLRKWDGPRPRGWQATELGRARKTWDEKCFEVEWPNNNGWALDYPNRNAGWEDE